MTQAKDHNSEMLNAALSRCEYMMRVEGSRLQDFLKANLGSADIQQQRIEIAGWHCIMNMIGQVREQYARSLEDKKGGWDAKKIVDAGMSAHIQLRQEMKGRGE